MSADRAPIGPPPRRPSTNVQHLLAANRTRSTPSDSDSLSSPEKQPDQQPSEVSPASLVESKEAKGAPRQVTFYMSVEDRQRAKAAYQATSGVEMDSSWSAFITRAVMAEVTRREETHNDGRRFSGGTQNLTPGRKLAP